MLECSLIPEIHGAMNIIGGKDDNDDSYPEKCWSCARGTIKASSITCYEMSMQIMTMQPRTVTMTMMEMVMKMSISRKLSCRGDKSIIDGNGKDANAVEDCDDDNNNDNDEAYAEVMRQCPR